LPGGLGNDRSDAALPWIWARKRLDGLGPTEGFVEYIRAKREVRHALVISDPQPVDSVKNVWASAGMAANIGIFLLLFGAFLYIGRAILLPVLAAAVIALTLAPLVKTARRFGISPWLTALVILVFGLGALSLLATALAGPVSQWIGRAPEIGATIQQKLSVLDQPLAALHELEGSLFGGSATGLGVSAPSVVLPVVAFLTPAAGELLLFFVTLYFFLVGQIELRNQAVAMFANRDSKLRFLKIMHDIERNLAGYLTVVTIINTAVGVIVAVGAWLVGLPSPAIFGLLAALLNYVPYIGPAVMVVALFGVGLVTFPSLSHAFIAPLGLIAVTTTEGHFVTPTIIGRRLTLNPLLVFLALAFWTWMWGPFGAVLAVPFSIVGLVVFNHLMPAEEVKLPD
jgi:predicted PurR-regulated permease PerM